MQCDCVAGGTEIDVAPTRRADVVSVTASGPGCAERSPQCMTRELPCPAYFVYASGEGTCHIEVQFTSGATAVTRDVTYRHAGSESCCGGFYATAGSESFDVN
jgi:hypothetical protein